MITEAEFVIAVRRLATDCGRSHADKLDPNETPEETYGWGALHAIRLAVLVLRKAGVFKDPSTFCDACDGKLVRVPDRDLYRCLKCGREVSGPDMFWRNKGN